MYWEPDESERQDWPLQKQNSSDWMEIDDVDAKQNWMSLLPWLLIYSATYSRTTDSKDFQTHNTHAVSDIVSQTA